MSIRDLFRRASRAIGAKVCARRGHRYFYPSGEIKSWCAYSCVRCGALDRPLESLPYAPDDDDDYYRDDERDARIEADHARERRVFKRLPFPRWL